MKTFILTLTLLLQVALVNAQTARVQVIHNSADAAASTVDVYLGATKILDDFAFRTASPFINAPAGTPIKVSIAPSNSTSVADSIAVFNYNLMMGSTYVLIAEGIISTSGYSPATPFDIKVYGSGREVASNAANTDVLIHHGATDAPAVDVIETGAGAGAIVTNAAYGDFAPYLELTTADYVLQVRATGATSAVAAFDAPLASLGLQGAALTVVASGFLDPASNSNGPAFGLFAAPAAGGPMVALSASTARLQAIHNSADAAADSVDVYLDGALLIDNFAFRTASPFIDAPAEVNIQLAIAPSNSSSVADSIAVFNYNLSSGETYVLVAEGIVSTTGYSPATPFDINVYGMGREVATNASNTDVLVHHGATDAPAVDVVETGAGAGVIVSNAAYGDFAPYLELGTADYVLQVRATGASTAVAAFDAPLATLGLQGAAITVVASGFLDPAANSNGPAFGLFVAPAAGGAMVALPASTARLQAIHNSADAAAATVDVYLDGNLLIDDFAFRTASPFIDAPAEVNTQLVIAPSNSTSVADSIAVFNYNLSSGETYVLVAEGIVSTSGYSPATPFDINVYGMGREAATNPTNTDVLVHHGATDAPAVDVVETGVGAGVIVSNAAYGDFAPYLELGTADYVLQVRATGASSAVAAFDAPLATLGLQGAALTVVASGFLDPAANSNGAAFGLFAAPATGGAMVELPASKARLQAIHNSADAAAASVDVYLNGSLLLDNFDFRTASPFIDAPAEVDIQLAIAPASSASVADSIAVFNYNLQSGETYILVADGIVSTTGYSPAAPFGINVYGMAREAATTSGNTDVLVHHGATDAPAVDVVEVGIGAGTIVTNAAYGDFAPYLELGTADYRLEIRATGSTTAVATYDAPLSTLALQDSAITVVASGFLDPTNNSNGAAFGLWVALPEGGTMIPLPVVTSLNTLQSIDGISMNILQNPVTDENLQIFINSSVNRNAQLSVIDMTGKTATTLSVDLQNGENYISVNDLSLGHGVYVVLLSNDEGVNAIRFVKK